MKPGFASHECDVQWAAGSRADKINADAWRKHADQERSTKRSGVVCTVDGRIRAVDYVKAGFGYVPREMQEAGD